MPPVGTGASEATSREATSDVLHEDMWPAHLRWLKSGEIKPILALVAQSQGQQPLRFTLSPPGQLKWPQARSHGVLPRLPHLLSHPLNKVLLCSERRHCMFLSVLKILQCRKLGDVESFCQGLVDSGIDSCKDTRALGWGRGQPCMTASDTVLAEEKPRRQPPAPPARPVCHWEWLAP